MHASSVDTTARPPFVASLQCATDAAAKLMASGCSIESTFHNGRRMVLLVDRPPAFVTGHMKTRHPNGSGGLTTLYAASFHGCQLEWSVDSESDGEVPPVARIR
jgi:hypothetical protein